VFSGLACNECHSILLYIHNHHDELDSLPPRLQDLCCFLLDTVCSDNICIVFSLHHIAASARGRYFPTRLMQLTRPYCLLRLLVLPASPTLATPTSLRHPHRKDRSHRCFHWRVNSLGRHGFWSDQEYAEQAQAKPSRTLRISFHLKLGQQRDGSKLSSGPSPHKYRTIQRAVSGISLLYHGARH
jgi:hypothetical protein